MDQTDRRSSSATSERFRVHLFLNAWNSLGCASWNNCLDNKINEDGARLTTDGEQGNQTAINLPKWMTLMTEQLPGIISTRTTVCLDDLDSLDDFVTALWLLFQEDEYAVRCSNSLIACTENERFQLHAWALRLQLSRVWVKCVASFGVIFSLTLCSCLKDGRCSSSESLMRSKRDH